MTNKASLLAIGFVTGRCLEEDEPDAVEEQQVAQSMLRFVISLLGLEINEGRVFSEFVPYRSPTLIDPDPEVQRRGRAYFREVWSALEPLERAAAESDDLANFATELVWTSQVWSRGLLTELAENGFGSLPVPLREEVEAVARAIYTSKPVEDTFNILRERERQHTGSKLGRTAR